MHPTKQLSYQKWVKSFTLKEIIQNCIQIGTITEGGMAASSPT